MEAGKDKVNEMHESENARGTEFFVNCGDDCNDDIADSANVDEPHDVEQFSVIRNLYLC